MDVSSTDPTIRNHASFIWSVADKLRGVYKQSEYGRVILPLVVLRRLDCVLEPTPARVGSERSRPISRRQVRKVPQATTPIAARPPGTWTSRPIALVLQPWELDLVRRAFMQLVEREGGIATGRERARDSD
jgi:hypothetical protein